MRMRDKHPPKGRLKRAEDEIIHSDDEGPFNKYAECVDTHTHTHKDTACAVWWGEGFNKPTVAWFYGGISGPCQETDARTCPEAGRERERRTERKKETENDYVTKL